MILAKWGTVLARAGCGARVHGGVVARAGCGARKAVLLRARGVAHVSTVVLRARGVAHAMHALCFYPLL